MTTRKNSSSVVKAVSGTQVQYLSKRDEEHCLDIALSLLGWEIVAL